MSRGRLRTENVGQRRAGAMPRRGASPASTVPAAAPAQCSGDEGEIDLKGHGELFSTSFSNLALASLTGRRPPLSLPQSWSERHQFEPANPALSLK